MKSIGVLGLILAVFVVTANADEKLFKKYGMMKVRLILNLRVKYNM